MKGIPFGARASLAVLFAINLANYMDRYLVIGLQEPIRETFHVTRAEIGLLTSAFVIVYMLASPICGYLADRIQRRYVVGLAVALWSVATALASRAAKFSQLLTLRGGVGIGEAGYNAAGQALLTDLYPEEKRNRVMAIFNLAMPLGVALGYVLAGILMKRLGDWRLCCLVVGAPGLLLAVMALGLPGGVSASSLEVAPSEPEGVALAVSASPLEIVPNEPEGGTLAAYLGLLTDPVFMTNTFGFAMQSFALGGLSVLAASFLMYRHDMALDVAELWTGGIVVGSGLVGTALGSLIGDALASHGRVRAYALVTGAGYLVAAPLLLIGLFLPTRAAALTCIFASMVGAFLGIGPQNAIVAFRAPLRHRATAFALVVFILHLFGDAASPPILGWVSDHAQGNHVPEADALREALLLTPGALVLAAIFMFACARMARPKSADTAP